MKTLIKILRAIPLAGAAMSMALMLVSANVASADESQLEGTFSGQSNHVTTGNVTIIEEGGKTILVLAKNFSLDGAPAPTIGFSKGGEFVKSTEFTKLENIKGGQSYVVPSNIDVSEYDAVTIWCADVSAPLGSAELK